MVEPDYRPEAPDKTPPNRHASARYPFPPGKMTVAMLEAMRLLNRSVTSVECATAMLADGGFDVDGETMATVVNQVSALLSKKAGGARSSGRAMPRNGRCCGEPLQRSKLKMLYPGHMPITWQRWTRGLHKEAYAKPWKASRKKKAMMPLTADRLAAIEISLSSERLHAWQRLVARPELAAWRARVGCKLPSSIEDAIRLHEWNASLSACMLHAIQVLELTIRNRIHTALTLHFGPDWWDTPLPTTATGVVPRRLVGEQQVDLDNAKSKFAKLGKPLTPGRIVAELTFGFWVSLTGPNYDNPSAKITHWRDCLYNVFAGAGPISRKQVHFELDELRKLRNRIAHHEQIVTRDLQSAHKAILHALMRVDSHAREWVLETSILPHVAKPDWILALKVAGRVIGAS